jgi:hypothetical protein
LSNCQELTDISFISLAINCPDLQLLAIKDIPAVTLESFNYLSTLCAGLKQFRLCLGGMYENFPWIEELFLLFPNLVHFELQIDPKLYAPRDTLNISNYSCIWNKLETLVMCSVFLSPSMLLSIAQTCQQLTHFEINFTKIGMNTTYSGTDFLNVSQSLSPTLRTFSIASSFFGGSEALRQLMIICSNIVHLDIGNCVRIKYDFIQTIRRHLPHLWTLDVSNMWDGPSLNKANLLILFDGFNDLERLNISCDFNYQKHKDPPILNYFKPTSALKLQELIVNGWTIPDCLSEEFGRRPDLKIVNNPEFVSRLFTGF